MPTIEGGPAADLQLRRSRWERFGVTADPRD
jgi:hypothetical protein